MDYLIVKETAADFSIATVAGEKKNFPKTFTVENFSAMAEFMAEKKGVLGAILVDFSKKFFLAGEETISIQKFLEEICHFPCIFQDRREFDLRKAFLKRQEEMIWEIEYFGYTPGKLEYAAESLLTVGNGFLGLRGTVPEMTISKDHYPATYLAGLYDEATSVIGEEKVTNEDFVNGPNGQFLTLLIDGEKLVFTQENTRDFKRKLNLKNGLFTSQVIFKTESGKEVLVEVKKFAHLKNFHTYGLTYSLTPLNFSGEIQVLSQLDGSVYNYNVARYRALENKHVEVVAQKGSQDVYQWSQTLTSNFQILMGAKLTGDFKAPLKIQEEKQIISQLGELTVKEGQKISVTKMVEIYVYPEEEKSQAQEKWQTPFEFTSFTEGFLASSQAWEALWEKMEIKVVGDLWSQKLLHLHTYHLVVSAAPFANLSLDASVTARGLHGEAYRGHIFWDELFILPFYFIHFPKTARQILMYRYRRLEMAKQEAKKADEKGAMYPWQSGKDGSEQSQSLHLNPLSGQWHPDHSRLQRHVSLAVAYNLWFYLQVTQDKEFLENYAGEMLLEIAKFWLGKAVYNEIQQRYEITGVMGPDEFHEAYPGSAKGGLKNNAYTNMMVVWLLETLHELFATLTPETQKRLLEKTHFTQEDWDKADLLQHHLRLEINPEGVIAQFEGYFNLKELDFKAYKEKYGNIYRMDRILAAEGKSADSYQVAKQADSLMIFYNLPKEKVDEILRDLNYNLPKDYVKKNLDYYLARTTHGSTLSRIVHAQLAELADEKQLAFQLYQEALASDYHDIQGGTTAEGIHAGVMGATLWSTLSTFAGLDLTGKIPVLTPNLPKEWQRLEFKFEFLQVQFSVTIDQESTRVLSNRQGRIKINGVEYALNPQEKITVFKKA